MKITKDEMWEIVAGIAFGAFMITLIFWQQISDYLFN